MGLPDRLRRLRKNHKMKQGELATAIGAHSNSVSKWERNGGNISQPYLVEISKKWNISIDWLLLGVGEMYLVKSSASDMGLGERISKRLRDSSLDQNCLFIGDSSPEVLKILKEEIEREFDNE